MSKPPKDAPIARAIRAYLDRTGVSARALSLKIGQNETYVRKVLGNGVTPGGDALAALAREMGVSADSLMRAPADVTTLDATDAVVPAPDVTIASSRLFGPSDVPVYGVADGGTNSAFRMSLTQGPVDYAARPMSLIRAQNLFAVSIQGDSMEPVWRAGDLVYCQGGRGYGPGDYVLIQVDAGAGKEPLSYIKRFVRQDDAVVVLAQHNPPAEMSIDRATVRQVWRALHWRELGR